MVFDFAQLMAHLAKTRELEAGSIIGSGTVSNKQGGLFGSSVANGGVGYCCIAELRMYETIEQGKPKTPFMRFGDRVRIEMRDGNGASIFGAIEQTVERYAALTGAGGFLEDSTSNRISSATDCGNPARAPSRLSSSRCRR
jgi:fumarylacetoacetate (FAA) hydrolase